jgi:tetratricopeptide (TPR) repeat protein
MYCPNCGKGNPKGARFCMHCGANMNGYMVEISPNIEVSPNIIVQMMDKEQINSLVIGKGNKILEKIISLNGIQKEKAKFTPKEIQISNFVMQIAKELDEKGKIDSSMYSDKIIESFVEFLDRFPDDFYEEINAYELLIYLKGAFLRGLGRYDEAIHCLDKVLEKNPKSVPALAEKGISIHLQSVKKMEYYLLIDKLKDHTKEELEEAWLASKKGAARYLNKALKINSHYSSAWIYKSFTEQELDGKIECLDKALEVDPMDKIALYHKGLFLKIYTIDFLNIDDYTITDMEKYKARLWEAVAWFDKTLRIDPNYTSALKGKEEALKELRGLP